jgi:hypothetical protein
MRSRPPTPRALAAANERTDMRPLPPSLDASRGLRAQADCAKYGRTTVLNRRLKSSQRASFTT